MTGEPPKNSTSSRAAGFHYQPPPSLGDSPTKDLPRPTPVHVVPHGHPKSAGAMLTEKKPLLQETDDVSHPRTGQQNSIEAYIRSHKTLTCYVVSSLIPFTALATGITIYIMTTEGDEGFVWQYGFFIALIWAMCLAFNGVLFCKNPDIY